MRNEPRDVVNARRIVQELERRRAVDCRLARNRALRSLTEAHAFLLERGMLTRMPDCGLPSLFGAIHEEPSRPGGRGFDLWPKTKWIWSFQLTQLPGVILTKLHQGRSLYLSGKAARLFDPLVRAAIESATDDERSLLDHLATHGASTADDIEIELGWDRKRLKRVRNRLERLGAVIGRGLVFKDSTDWFFAPMLRWDQIVPRSKPPDDPYAALALGGIRAAVIAPESNIRSWFSFAIPTATLDNLVSARRLTRPAHGLIALGDRRG